MVGRARQTGKVQDDDDIKKNECVEVKDMSSLLEWMTPLLQNEQSEVNENERPSCGWIGATMKGLLPNGKKRDGKRGMRQIIEQDVEEEEYF